MPLTRKIQKLRFGIVYRVWKEETTEEIIMTVQFTKEQMQHIHQQVREGLQQVGGEEKLGASFGCWACRIALNASIGGVLVPAFATGIGEAAVAIVGPIAVATGLAEGTVTGILARGGATSVEGVIEELCEAMNAC